MYLQHVLLILYQEDRFLFCDVFGVQDISDQSAVWKLVSENSVMDQVVSVTGKLLTVQLR